MSLSYLYVKYQSGDTVAITIKHKKVKRKVDDKPFPKLMKDSSDVVVLFTSEGSGTVVSGDFWYSTGLWASTWNPKVFKDFKGELRISNT